MNKYNRHSFTSRLQGFCAVTALGAITLSAFGQAAPSGKLKVVAAAKVADGNQIGDNQTIEIRVVDGKASVTCNGKEIADGQVKVDNGRVIVLDKDGKELEGMKLDVFGHDGGKFWVGAVAGGDGDVTLDKVAQVDVTEPKVMLGVQMTETSPALEYHLGLDHGATTMILGIFQSLPAYDAGIRQYDIITKVNGHAPADSGSIHDVLKDREPGDTVTFTIIHEGRTKDVTVKLEKYDAEAMGKAKLFGSAGDTQTWTYSIPGLQGLGGRLGNLKGMQHVFVAPSGELPKQFQDLQPQIQQLLKEHIQQGAGQQNKEGVDDELDKLDRRMAELERLLQELVKKAEHGR